MIVKSALGFEVKVIAHSINQADSELLTLQLRYPRFIHSEFMTHRVFSRNAMSSRAVPVAKMIAQVLDDPAMPVFWGKNQPGMQAKEELTGVHKEAAILTWKQAAAEAARFATILSQANVHKQIVNRVLEPWQWMHTIVSSTEWDNFFELRCHEDAQPEFHHLADLMLAAKLESIPEPLSNRDHHLPYVDHHRDAGGNMIFTSAGSLISTENAIKCSVARCARVSYLTHDGKVPSLEEDLKLYERLVGGVPVHASPAEHQARSYCEEDEEDFDDVHFVSNFHDSWIQFRKILEWNRSRRTHRQARRRLKDA